MRVFVVRRIQAQYGATWGTVRGGAAGLTGTPQVVTLNDGETITAMTLSSAAAGGGSIFVGVCYMKIETSQGRTLGPFDAGCTASVTTTRFVLGSGLAYLSGACGDFVDALILNYLSTCVNGRPVLSFCLA